MDGYTPEELAEARRSIASTLSKCEKALLKLTPGRSQHTLTARRIRAFQIALDHIARQAGTKFGSCRPAPRPYPIGPRRPPPAGAAFGHWGLSSRYFWSMWLSTCMENSRAAL